MDFAGDSNKQGVWKRRKDNRKKGCYERMLRLAIRQRRDIKFCSTNYSKDLLNDFCKYAIIKNNSYKSCLSEEGLICQ